MKHFYGLFFFLFFFCLRAFSQNCGVKSSFTPFGDTTVDVNTALTLNSTSSNATSLAWYLNGFLFSNNSSFPLPFRDQYGGAGVYQVQLIASNGTCRDTSQCTFVATSSPPSVSNYKINIGNEYVEIHPITIMSTTDSGYIVVGEKVATIGFDGSKIYIIKFSGSGCMQWSKLIFKIGADGFKKIKQTKDGGYMLLGYTPDIYNNSTVFFSSLIKFDKNGQFEWEKNFRPKDVNGVMSDVEETGDGYVFGGNLDKGFQIVKVDLRGNIVWNRAISFAKYHQVTGLVYRNNTIIAIGYSLNEDYSKYSSFAVKLNAVDGSSVWMKDYRYSDRLLFNEVNTWGDKMYITMFGTNGLMYGIMDTNGTISNITQLGNSAMNFTVRPIDDNNVMVFFRYKETLSLQPYYQYHSVVAKVSLSGNVEWARHFSNYPRDYFSAATVSADKNIEMLGIGYNHLERAYMFYWNMMVVKVSNDGTTPACDFDPIQLYVSRSSISASNVIPVTDTTLAYTTSTVQHIIQRPYTETIFDCPGYYTGCNSLVAGSFDTTCNITKVYKLRYTKGYGCFTPVMLDYNHNDLQILDLRDSVVTFKFLRYGSVKLKMWLQTPCKNIMDSVVLVAVDKRLNNFSLGEDFRICTGMSKTLDAGSGFSSYLWQDSSTAATYTVTLPGTYFVTVTDTCGNVYSDTVVAKLSLSVPINAGPDITKCNTDSVKLTAPPGFIQYSWAPGYNIINSQSQNPTIYPTADTAYILSVKNEQGCMGYDTIRVKVHISPSINLGNDTTLCTSKKIRLDAGNAFISYLWNNGSTSSTLTLRDSGIYSVTAKDINSCISRDTIHIALQTTPAFSLGNDTLVCDNRKPLLQAIVNGSYLWQNGSVEKQQKVTVSGLYWLEVNDMGCSYRDSIVIDFKPSPKVNLGNDTTICEGATKKLNIDTPYTDGSWQDNSSASTYSVSRAGTYWVIVDLNGCSSSDTVNIFQKLKPRFDLGKDTFLCVGQTLPLKVEGNATSYLWSTGSVSSSYTITSPGVYKLTAINECGSFSDEIVVNIGVCNIDMPTAFTPNKDGLNDVFRIKYPASVKAVVMKIFNRFGQLVFSTSDATRGWDGAINGMPQDIGNYIWIINYETIDGAKGSLKGSVLLIR